LKVVLFVPHIRGFSVSRQQSDWNDVDVVNLQKIPFTPGAIMCAYSCFSEVFVSTALRLDLGYTQVTAPPSRSEGGGIDAHELNNVK
jgi:hypothetical protein